MIYIRSIIVKIPSNCVCAYMYSWVERHREQAGVTVTKLLATVTIGVSGGGGGKVSLFNLCTSKLQSKKSEVLFLNLLLEFCFFLNVLFSSNYFLKVG